MLHNIAEKADDAYTITPRGFKAFIESIQKTIDVDEYGKSDGRYVLSFDDAFAGVYDIARPLLKEKKLKYYIFICNEYIDKAGYLSREQIKELAKDENCIIGSHLMTHRLARFMDQKELEKQMIDSQRELSILTGREIKDFAFPYGSFYACSRKNIRSAEKYFAHIFLTLPLPYDGSSARIYPRINVNEKNYREVLK